MAPSNTFGLALHLLLLSLPIATAQQVGSFFTAIYLNGAVVSSSQTSCADMGQSQYCCGAGASCAWDDNGKVACCASGTNCQGSAYGSSAAVNSGQYYASSTTWQQPSSTLQPQGQATSDCHCDESSINYNNGGNVIPIVPVTQVMVLTSYTPVTTAYAQYPATTTVTPVQGNVVATSTGRCSNGAYSTIVEANVGAPSRTVGCYIIINGANKVKGILEMGKVFALWALTSTTLLVGWFS